MQITIVHLADRPEFRPALTDWYASAWEPYYGPAGPGNAEADLKARFEKEGLPSCLIALGDGELLLGSASVTPASVADRPELTPWLSALLVATTYSVYGVADLLIEAAEDHACRLNYPSLYCDAVTEATAKGPDLWEEASPSLLVARNWTEIGGATSLRGATAIFGKTLQAP